MITSSWTPSPAHAGCLRRLVYGVLFAVVALGVFAPAVPAQAASAGFAADLKKQNAHHLKSKTKLIDRQAPHTITRDYEEKVTRRAWTLREGSLSVNISLKKEGPPDGLLFMRPVATIAVNGKTVIRGEGAESFPDNPVFVAQIAELDPSNPHPEVVLSVYTGGAHCCSDTLVFTSSRDGRSWKEVTVGVFDGEPLEARDLDGDGRYEFAMRDNAFLYSFGCYACSTAPLHVLRLNKGQMVNVSANPAFKRWQLDSLRTMLDWGDDTADRNGFLAGFVAQKALVGEGRNAWALMLKHYDKESDWGLDHCTVKLNKKGECPKDKVKRLTFPKALEKFLKETGYDLDQ